jgi:hypothetical protein
VDWEIIAKVKDALHIPVVANGGIQCYADVQRCLDFTGADAVMSSEALLENPKLFSPEGDAAFQYNYIRAQLTSVREYLSLVHLHSPPRPFYQVVRSHLFRMLYRFMDAPANRDLRAKLANGHSVEIAEVLDELDTRATALGYDPALAVESGFLNGKSWYMRHRGKGCEDRRLANRRRYRAKHHRKGNQGLEPGALKDQMESLKKRLQAKHASAEA